MHGPQTAHLSSCELTWHVTMIAISVVRVLDCTLFTPTSAVLITLLSFCRSRRILGPALKLRDHLEAHKWLRRLVIVVACSRINRALNRLVLNRGWRADKPNWSKVKGHGDKVVITGGAAGIGHEAVKILARRTLNIAVLDMAEPTSPVGEAVGRSVHCCELRTERRFPAGVLYLRCDVTNDKQIAKAAERIRQEVNLPETDCVVLY